MAKTKGHFHQKVRGWNSNAEGNAMRISVQACIEGEVARPAKVITIGVLEREDGFAPSAGLGFLKRETQTLLKQHQKVFLEEQVDQFFDASARCLACDPAAWLCTKTFPDSAVGRYISHRDPDRATVKSAFHAVMTMQQFGIATTQAARPGWAQPSNTTGEPPCLTSMVS